MMASKLPFLSYEVIQLKFTYTGIHRRRVKVISSVFLFKNCNNAGDFGVTQISSSESESATKINTPMVFSENDFKH